MTRKTKTKKENQKAFSEALEEMMTVLKMHNAAIHEIRAVINHLAVRVNKLEGGSPTEERTESGLIVPKGTK